jgi:NTE family protein
MVAGTSAGAVNAAYFALHPHRLDRLEAIWLALRTQDVFPGTRFHVLMNLIRLGHIHRSDEWESLLRKEVGQACFEDMTVPCAVVAVRLSDGARVVFDSGEVIPALMASTAIPGIFPPYRIGEEQYVDGGVLEYMPIPTLLESGATTIYALDCSSYGLKMEHAGSVVDRCARITARDYVRRVSSLQEARGRTVYLLQPELPEFDDSRDFGFTAELMLAGYDQARKFLSEQLGAARPGQIHDSRPHAG